MSACNLLRNEVSLILQCLLIEALCKVVNIQPSAVYTLPSSFPLFNRRSLLGHRLLQSLSLTPVAVRFFLCKISCKTCKNKPV